MQLNKKALIELAKSAGRYLYFGLLGLVSAFLASLLADQSLANSYVTVGNTQLPVGFLIVLAIGSAAKAIDRYQHVDPNNPSKGIAPKFLQG